MSSPSMTSIKLLLFLSMLLMAHSFEFDAGGPGGWVVPSHKDPEFFNEWASKNRFQIGDIIKFEYKKDSVLVVTQEEYAQCNASHPLFFSNNGKTEYRLDRSGLYYFISGATGHCDRGQKMIIKVLSHGEAPGGSPGGGGNDSSTPTPPSKSSGVHGVGDMSRVFELGVVLLLGSLFF